MDYKDKQLSAEDIQDDTPIFAITDEILLLVLEGMTLVKAKRKRDKSISPMQKAIQIEQITQFENAIKQLRAEHVQGN